jgi:hypothetical protein
MQPSFLTITTMLWPEATVYHQKLTVLFAYILAESAKRIYIYTILCICDLIYAYMHLHFWTFSYSALLDLMQILAVRAPGKSSLTTV